MSTFSLSNGYMPSTFDEIMDEVRLGVNAQFSTSYTPESFVGTAWYKYAYRIVQRMIESEAKTSEIFQKLQDFLALTNERIQRPSVSHPGLLDSFATKGFIVSVKKPVVMDAGTVSICVEVDHTDPSYPEKRLEICEHIKDFIAAGIVSLGTEVETLVLSNGQDFDFKYSLPDRHTIHLRIFVTISENTLVAVPNDEAIRNQLLANILSRYRLGWNFEPQRYYGHDDAPWADTIVLEWSSNDGEDWNDDTFISEFDDLFEFDLGRIEVNPS